MLYAKDGKGKHSGRCRGGVVVVWWRLTFVFGPMVCCFGWVGGGVVLFVFVVVFVQGRKPMC